MQKAMKAVHKQDGKDRMHDPMNKASEAALATCSQELVPFQGAKSPFFYPMANAAH